MTLTTYSNKHLAEMARRTLANYRKAHQDKTRKYVFAEVPWFISISDNGVTLNVQIMNRETRWTENTNIAI